MRGSTVLGVLFLAALMLPGDALAQAPEAESYYLENIQPAVASKCINCHWAGGIAAYTPLIFSASASSNHDIFDYYVNSPVLGARASTVLAKIRGDAGHGGGVQVPSGSAEYQKFERYMVLLSQTVASYSVTPSTNAGGSITPETVQAVEENGTAAFTLAPAVGYELSEVAGTCGGTLSGSTYTTASVTADCTVVASFSEIVGETFVVTPSSDTSGSISPSSAQTVESGASVSFTLRPNDGYEIAGVGGTCGGTLSGSTYTTASVTADCTLEAQFQVGAPSVPQAPTITRTDVGDGEIYLSATVTDDGGRPVTSYLAHCTDGTNTYTGTSGTSAITVLGLSNEVAYTCTATATNSVGESSASAATDPITPEQIASGLPIWLLYQATQ